VKPIDLDALVSRAASRELRQMQYSTFAAMEPSVHMTVDVFRQLAEAPEVDYTSVRTVLGAHAQMASPRTYLEIGTRRGHSLCMVARCAPEPPEVYSFDLWLTDYAGEANPGPDLVRRELDKLGFRGKVHFYGGDSTATIPAFFQDPANPQEIDCVFVDGDHSIEGARADLLNVVDHISVGGLLVFDDITHPAHPGLLGVWREIMARRPEFDVRENTRHEYGWTIALRTR
jgi:predicted O-methyltransferase YrrM